MLFKQEAAAPFEQAPELTVSWDPVAIVFIFVAFVVVANLVSKHLKMKHERALKFGEAQQGSLPNQATVIFLVLAATAALLFFRVGGMDHLAPVATVFIFVAFVVVAKLVSKHLTMLHEQPLKKAEVDIVQPKVHTLQNTSNSGWMWIIGLLFAAGCVVVLVLVSFVGFEVPNTTVKSVELNTPQQHGVIPPTAVGSISAPPKSIQNWGEDLPFAANQYPGIEACAAPLARMIAREIEADQAADGKAEEAEAEVEAILEVPTTVFVVNGTMNGSWWYNGANFGTFEDAFKKALKSEMPSVSFHSQTGNKTYTLNFGFEELQDFAEAYPDGTLGLKSGKIVCRSAELRAKSLSVSFLQKPWLTHIKEFTTHFPDGRYYVGATSQVEPLKSKAHERAVQDLADRLQLRPDQLESNIVDSFTQTIERPYGKVYREAILVHQEAILAQYQAGRVLKQRNTQGKTSRVRRVEIIPPSFEFSLAMIVCLTVVAGFISNIVTQGYYRTGISRSVMVVSALAVVFILVIVLGHLA